MSHPPAAFDDAIRAPRAPVAPLPVEWRGLAERLAAAHALRQVLGEDTTTTPHVASGSFDANVARALATHMPHDETANDQACHDINRLASTDGKPADGKDTAHAGTPISGDRGLR